MLFLKFVIVSLEKIIEWKSYVPFNADRERMTYLWSINVGIA